MGDVVEVDDGPDVEEIQTELISNHSSSFEDLRTLKREMEFRGSQLGKTWSELSKIMTKYQSQLVHKHEHFESSKSAGEQGRTNQFESVIHKQTNDISKLQKSVADLERRLLEKDGEIVRLRTEVHKLRNEVTMKDSLIQKLQNQMAKEAMEYAAEISSLKDMLQMDSQQQLHLAISDNGAVAKKRRISTPAKLRVASDIQAFNSPDHELVKNDSIYHHPPSSQSNSDSGPQFPRPIPVNNKNHTQTSSEFEPGYSNDQSGDAVAAQEHQDFNESGDVQFYNLEEVGEEAGQDVMADLMEQKPIIDPSQLDLSLHSSPGGSQQFAAPQPSPLTAQATSSDLKCSICGKDFVSNWYMQRHLRTHYNIRPYQCILCHLQFTQKGHGISHIMTKHRDHAGNPYQFIVKILEVNMTAGHERSGKM